ncbi:MAG TPA: hypothetical protein VFX00_06435 [Pedococcus sp.]|nr:hypothetical protein [Pedococcus sp.]
MRLHRTTAALALAVALGAPLAGCAGDPQPGASGSSTSSPTVTVTVTRTVPGPMLTTATAPPTTASTPPPGRDSAPLPDNARDYAGAFVTAWAERDKPRAEQLATPTVVQTTFASSVPTPPRLTGCEGAAGSSYCTYEGDEYTMTVRVQNEMASRRAPHAVTEVRFGH